MLLKWAISLLAKTSHSVYEEVVHVIQLTTLSYILRKNNEIVGEQGVSGYYGVHITHINSMSKETYFYSSQLDSRSHQL